MFKSLYRCLPELSLFIINLLYNGARWMNDLGVIKVPSWFLSVDVSSISLILLMVVLIVKNLGEKNV